MKTRIIIILSLLLSISLIYQSCKKRKDEIPPAPPVVKDHCDPNNNYDVYYSEDGSNFLTYYRVRTTENPTIKTYTFDHDVDLGESEVRQMKRVFNDEYSVIFNYDSNGDEVWKSDTIWGTEKKPTRSIEYQKNSFGSYVYTNVYHYDGDLLTRLDYTYSSSTGTVQNSSTYYYYNGNDCIKKVSSSSPNDSTFVTYTYTDHPNNLQLFYQFGNHGTRLLQSANYANRNYSGGTMTSEYTISESYNYTFEGDSVIKQTHIRPGSNNLYMKYVIHCN